MAEKTTIARPYADAIFEMAQAKGDYKSWSDMLAVAVEAAANEDMGKVIGNPNIESADQAAIFTDVCGSALDEQGKNLIKLLGENGRLDVVAEIAALYEELRATAEGTIQADVVSASELSDVQKQSIAAALKARLGRDIELNCSTDDSMLGGVQIRAGDLVIDGSVATKLSAMSNALLH